MTRPDGLPIAACDACGAYFVNPQPTTGALERFYASGYFDGAHDFFRGTDYFDARDAAIRRCEITGWDLLGSVGVGGKSILDVGCASGALLQLARLKGARRVKGIELDAEIAGRGLRAYGIDIAVGEVLEVLAHETEKFDIVTAFDLVEHVKSPAMLFERVAAVLAPCGRFVFSVPNGHCLDIWRTAWIGYRENMEHLVYLRRQDLDRLAGHAGLVVERIQSRGFPLPLREYRAQGEAARGKRILAQPAVALNNALAKIRYALFGRQQGHELAAILLKPA
jgi:SAM-dependent methyltransferase